MAENHRTINLFIALGVGILAAAAITVAVVFVINNHRGSDASAPTVTVTQAPTQVEVPPVNHKPIPQVNHDNIQQFKTSIDAIIDELNPAKDQLAAALRTGDPQTSSGCTAVGDVGRQIDALLPSPLVSANLELQKSADEFTATETDCRTLGPGSTEADANRLLSDFEQAMNDFQAAPQQ
jgi:hypothetical protein